MQNKCTVNAAFQIPQGDVDDSNTIKTAKKAATKNWALIKKKREMVDKHGERCGAQQ